MSKSTQQGHVSLIDFSLDMQAEIARFKGMWLKNHEVDPEHWPLDLPPGEWYEQFTGWQSGGGADLTIEPPEVRAAGKQARP